jgi:hypothetical protein
MRLSGHIQLKPQSGPNPTQNGGQIGRADLICGMGSLARAVLAAHPVQPI